MRTVIEKNASTPTRTMAPTLGIHLPRRSDAIATPTGELVLLDVNAWPSFALYRDEASAAIASYLAMLWVLRHQCAAAGDDCAEGPPACRQQKDDEREDGEQGDAFHDSASLGRSFCACAKSASRAVTAGCI